MDATATPNFDYIARAYRWGEDFVQAANAGDHEFLTRNGWIEVYRETNPGGSMVLYKRSNAYSHPRVRQ